MKIFIILILVLCLVLTVAGYYMAGFSMRIPRQTLEQARTWQEDHYDLSWYDGLPKNNYEVKGMDGYLLHVQFVKNPKSDGRYIIISHGYTDNRFGALKYGSIYLKLGYSLIIYDLRGHGLNEETFCTYSAREKQDLNLLIRDTRNRYDDIKVLGIHGESLGAATSVACLQYRPDIDFVVADCGFSDISEVLKRGLSGMHLPPFLIDIASLCAKIRFGYSYADMRPIDCLSENQIPILFLHGENDDFIVPEHSRRMSKSTAGYSEFHLIPGAGHAESVLVNHELYARYVEEFLRKVL